MIPQLSNREYWKRYVQETDARDIVGALDTATFDSGGEQFELAHFTRERADPCILISPGSAGHAYVFAELAYRMHVRGYNVLIMPRHGGRPIADLVRRHQDALRYIGDHWNDRIGIFGEGLGGFVTFYVALTNAPIRSMVCQNSPALLTEPSFHAAVLGGGAAGARRRKLLPLMRAAARVAPGLAIPISTYLDFREMVDPTSAIEPALIDAYLHDPDFDRRYPLSAVLSLLTTAPPRPLDQLAVPTMFIVPNHGFAPEYTKELFTRLPEVRKKLVEVEGSVFWMVSHPRQASATICDWFDETVTHIAQPM